MKVLFLSLLFFTFIPTVSAHMLVTSGNVSAVLHIEPNDDPVIGATSTISIIFQNDASELDLEHCDCTVSVAHNTIYYILTNKHSELHITPKNFSFDYVFREPGLYEVRVTGKTFDLMYDLHVGDPAVENTMHMSPWAHVIHYGLFGIAIGYGIYAIVQSELEKRRGNV